VAVKVTRFLVRVIRMERMDPPRSFSPAHCTPMPVRCPEPESAEVDKGRSF
jgi:hypothetical protein